jgi:CYTH domain-containing protein
MALERERKFIIDPAKLPPEAFEQKFRVKAGYFTETGPAIRVTHRPGKVSKVCIKGPGAEERLEFEYKIPDEDALELLKICPTGYSKIRYEYNGWEIDQFFVDPDWKIPYPIWIAEYEERPGKRPVSYYLFDTPKWVVDEVTYNPKYSNQSLAWEFKRLMEKKP